MIVHLCSPLLALSLVSEHPVPTPETVAPVLDPAYSLKVNRVARGLGFGFNQGVFGDGFGQSLHLDVPLGRKIGQFYGLRLQGTIVHPCTGPCQFSPDADD